MNKKAKTPVILDTNALIMLVEYRIDFEGELMELLGGYEIFVPSTVIHELRNIKNANAKAALKLTKRYRNIESVKRGDDAILSLALKLDAVVLTNDRELRGRLKENGLRTVYIRQRSYLEMDIP